MHFLEWKARHRAINERGIPPAQIPLQRPCRCPKYLLEIEYVHTRVRRLTPWPIVEKVTRWSARIADLRIQGAAMTLKFNRRQAMTLGATAMGAAALGLSAGPAFANNDANEAIQKFTGGKKPAEGRVKLDLPEIAENGNTVPMTVTVESPMTAQSHVTDVLILADGNPRSGVATFHFSPESGMAEAN